MIEAISDIIVRGLSAAGFSVSEGMHKDTEANALIYEHSRAAERVKRLRRSTHNFALSLRSGSLELVRMLAHVYSRV